MTRPLREIVGFDEARVRNLYGKKVETGTRYLYHASDHPDLHSVGIEPSRVDKAKGEEENGRGHAPQRRSYFASDKDETEGYGKHTYRIDLHHPNMAKHVFHKNYNGPTGEFVTRQKIPPGEHLKKVNTEGED